MASLGAVAALGLVFLVDTSRQGPTVCLFRIGVGLPCPGCGLTRAALRLVHGDLLQSLRLHPFAALAALEAAAAWMVVGWRLHRALPLALPRGTERWAMAHVVAMLALWLGRLATGTAPL